MKALILLATFLYSVIGFAQTQGEQAVLQRIQSAQQAIYKAAQGNTQDCNPQTGKECRFEAYCQQLVKNRDRTYLYKNSEGRNVPNYNMLALYENLQVCSQGIDRGLEEKPLNQDPFIYNQEFQNPKNKEKFQNEINRIAQLMDDSKKLIVSLLEKRKNGKNNDQIESLVRRVQTAKLNIPQAATVPEEAAYGCFLPGAFYLQGSHELVVCPSLMNMPDATLQRVLAHELAHTIDPCNLTSPLREMNAQHPQSQHGFVIPNQDSRVYMSSDTSYIQGLKGPLTEKALVSKPIDLNQTPFASTMQCLSEKDSYGFELPSIGFATKVIKQKIKEIEKLGAQPDDSSLQQLNITQQIIESDSTGNVFCEADKKDLVGEYREYFAEWLSTEAMALKLSQAQSPEQARQWAFESEMIFYQQDCFGFNDAQYRKTLSLTKNKNCRNSEVYNLAEKDFKSLNSGKAGHLYGAKRVERIYMAHPEVQKALGCQAPSGGAKRCE